MAPAAGAEIGRAQTLSVAVLSQVGTGKRRMKKNSSDILRGLTLPAGGLGGTSQLRLLAAQRLKGGIRHEGQPGRNPVRFSPLTLSPCSSCQPCRASGALRRESPMAPASRVPLAPMAPGPRLDAGSRNLTVPAAIVFVGALSSMRTARRSPPPCGEASRGAHRPRRPRRPRQRGGRRTT